MGAKSEKIFKDIQFVHSNHEMDMLKKIGRIVNIQKMPNLIYMQQPEIPLTNFDEILQKNL